MSRTLGNLIALVGAGWGGYARGQQMAREEQAAQEDRSFERKRRARMEADWQREDDERRALADAAKPPAVENVPGAFKPDTMDNIDVGQPGEAAPSSAGYRVGARMFSDRAGADAAAAEANTPEAVMRRQAAAMQGINPARAAQLSAQANTTKLQGLQLDEAEQKHLDAMHDREVDAKVNSWDDIANLTGWKLARTPDGKRVTFMKQGADGALVPVGKDFAVGDLDTAKELLKKIPNQAKLSFLHQQAQLAQQAAESQKNRDTQLQVANIQQEGADRRARMTMDGRTATGRDDHFDARQWDAAYKIDPNFTAFDNPDTGKAVQSPELRNVYVQRMNELRARGDLSPQQAQEAANTTVLKLRDKADQLVQASQGSAQPLNHQQAVQQVLRAYAAAQRQPAAAPTAAPGAAPATPAAPAAAPTPKGDGKTQAAALQGPQPFADFVAANITTKDGKRAIYNRVSKELPALQAQIQADAQLMANPNLAREVKAKLKAKIDAQASDAQMMQAFLDGNSVASLY